MKNRIQTILAFMLLLSMSSCLKEKAMNIDITKGPANMIEFANTGDDVSGSSSFYPRFTSDLGSVGSGKSVTFNVNISYSGNETAQQDITISLATDPATLATFNTQNGTTYELPPTDIFSFPPTAIIKKGERLTQVQVKITNNSSFDFNKNYALPLKITSASAGTISSNFGSAVYSFSARNAYDGIYTMEATAPMVDVLNSNITGWYPKDMQLITYTGNSVALYYVGISGYGHPIQNGGSGSYYGSFSPVFFFDNSGKVTSVTNYYGQNAGGNKRSAVLDPSGVNQATFNADGTIKSFQVSYIMTQSVSSPDAPRTYFHEKFTYKGAR